MTRVTTCDDCNQREPIGFQQDGVCRECRGITPPKRTSRGYVSPSRVERDTAALGHAEARNRAAITTLSNGRDSNE